MSNIRIKAKFKNGKVKAKVQIKHEMMTYNEAKSKGVKANFITHITAKVGEKVVYELSSSQFLSKDPILKFQFIAKKGELLSITWQDLSGKIVTESKKIK
jgi:sulfur-oxidizing protein SoxZ